MRKLKLQTQVSLDGFMAGPNGEMDWMTWNWDNELKNYTWKITENVDCIVMGKSFAAGFIPHWEAVTKDPKNPEYEFGKIMTDVQKVVFSKKVAPSSEELKQWPNTIYSEKSLADGISELKQQNGEDIIAYGGSAFVSSLIKEHLIDEYQLFINPTAIGKGMPLFNQLLEKLPLKLDEVKKFDCGIVVLKYLKE